jgi:hypothetical protein
MTFDELLAEAEARRCERRAFVAVSFIPRNIPRRVRFEPHCGCAMCGEVRDERSGVCDGRRLGAGE